MADETIKQKVLVEYEAKAETANNIASVLAGPIAAKLDAIADKFSAKIKKTGEFLNEHITKVPGFEGIPEGSFGYKNGVSRTPAQAMASWFSAGGQTSHFQTTIYNRAALESSNVEVDTKDGFPLVVHRLNQEWKDETERAFREADAARKGLAAVKAARSASERIQKNIRKIDPNSPHYMNRVYATLAANEMRSIARTKKFDLDEETRGHLGAAADALTSAYGVAQDPEKKVAKYEKLQARLEAQKERKENAEKAALEKMEAKDSALRIKYWTKPENIVGGMNADERKEFAKYYKTLEKNTGYLGDINDAFKRILMSGTAAHVIDRVAGAYFGYRTATLTDTQTPYSTSILARSSMVSDLGGELAGIGALAAPATGGWSLILTAIGLGAKIAAMSTSSDENIRQATWKRSRDMLKNTALYGTAVDYNYAQAAGQTGYISAGEMLNLNKTAAMVPGAMAFGALGENEMWALSMMPNYWRGLMSGASTSELTDLFKNDLDRLPEAWRPYLASVVPGGSENLRAFTNSDAYWTLSRNRGAFAEYDTKQYPYAEDYAMGADSRILDDLRQENINFLEKASRIEGIYGSLDDILGYLDSDVRREDVAEGIRLGLERSKETLRDINSERSENITITLDGERLTPDAQTSMNNYLHSL